MRRFEFKEFVVQYQVINTNEFNDNSEKNLKLMVDEDEWSDVTCRFLSKPSVKPRPSGRGYKRALR